MADRPTRSLSDWNRNWIASTKPARWAGQTKSEGRRWRVRGLATLQWFTSYLSSRTSTVGIRPHSSPSSPLTCEVPQGSVRGPVLFNLYTTHLSSLISACYISHLLYVMTPNSSLSFVSKILSSAINNLQFTIIILDVF